MIEPTALTSVGQIALHVTSIDDTERFYRDVLGLPHLYTFGDLTFFDAGGTRLYFQAIDPDKWVAGSIVYFRVRDIHAAYERLTKSDVRFTGAPHMIHRHGDGTEEWMVFFTDPVGRHLLGWNITHSFHTLSKAAGIRQVRFHDLRHTAATLWLAAGMGIDMVSKNLGHSSFAITVDTYDHATPARRDALADVMDRLFGAEA